VFALVLTALISPTISSALAADCAASVSFVFASGAIKGDVGAIKGDVNGSVENRPGSRSLRSIERTIIA
jgi:hypothetical protein